MLEHMAIGAYTANSRSSIISKSITMLLSGTPFYRIESRDNVSSEISFCPLSRNFIKEINDQRNLVS